MKITLLSHQKESFRQDNTGILCRGINGLAAEQVIWQRTEPDLKLCNALAQNAVLITPDGNGQKVIDIDAHDHFVLLDGTWQEAKKMYNRSPYLKSAPWFSLDNPPPSRFNLRRNQVEGGLCTAECVIELLKLKRMSTSAAQLEAAFDAFIRG